MPHATNYVVFKTTCCELHCIPYHMLRTKSYKYRMPRPTIVLIPHATNYILLLAICGTIAIGYWRHGLSPAASQQPTSQPRNQPPFNLTLMLGVSTAFRHCWVPSVPRQFRIGPTPAECLSRPMRFCVHFVFRFLGQQISRWSKYSFLPPSWRPWLICQFLKTCQRTWKIGFRV